MAKKFSAIVLVLIILTVYSSGAFAGGGTGSTTDSSISGNLQRSQSITESAITSEGAIAGESSISTKGAIAASKTDFEAILTSALEDGTAINNGEFIMTITSPDKDKDSTYMKSYVLSGYSKNNDIVISIAKYNEKTGKYEPMYNTDGESSWEISSSGLFSKEIVLTPGTNKIKIMSHRTSQKEEITLEKIQINCFTIELLKESIFGKAINKAKDITGDISSALGIDSLFRNKAK